MDGYPLSDGSKYHSYILIYGGSLAWGKFAGMNISSQDVCVLNRVPRFGSADTQAIRSSILLFRAEAMRPLIYFLLWLGHLAVSGGTTCLSGAIPKDLRKHVGNLGCSKGKRAALHEASQDIGDPMHDLKSSNMTRAQSRILSNRLKWMIKSCEIYK